MARTPSPSSSKTGKELVTNRSADAIAELTTPAATRSGVALKAHTQIITQQHEYLPPLPKKLPRRPHGFWKIRSPMKLPPEVGKTTEPDHQKIIQTKVQVDIDLLPYWGNIDDKSKIHLFDRPAENYVPITVPGTASFTDTLQVCYYLINFMY